VGSIRARVTPETKSSRRCRPWRCSFRANRAVGSDLRISRETDFEFPRFRPPCRLHEQQADVVPRGVRTKFPWNSPILFSGAPISFVAPLISFPRKCFPSRDSWRKEHVISCTEPRNLEPGKMTFTTASGLLPAGIAVYVQREPNGVGLETRYSVGL